MSVEIEIYPEKLAKLEAIVKQAFEMTIQAVLTDVQMSQTIPKDTGELERSSFYEVDVEELVGRIVFDTPYARRLYWHPEYNFRTDKNQYAGGMWLQPYIDGVKKDFVRETFAKFLKQLGGGLIS